MKDDIPTEVKTEAMKQLHTKVDTLQNNISDIDRDLANDRKDIDQMKLEMANIVGQQKVIMQEIARLGTKTQDAVHGAVEKELSPFRDDMKKMSSILNRFVDQKKKLIYFQPESPFWKRLLFWKNR